jgi:hypothetical protein
VLADALQLPIEERTRVAAELPRSLGEAEPGLPPERPALSVRFPAATAKRCTSGER